MKPTNRTAGIVSLALCGLILTITGCGSTADATGAAAAGPAELAARIGDYTISMAELDAEGRKRDAKTYQALYDSRRQTLQTMIESQLLDTEAAARGIAVDDLVQQEIQAKVATVGDAEIQAFYDQNKARIGDRTVDQVRPQIQQMLVNQNIQRAQQTYMASLREKAGVEISLEPPRTEVSIAANDPRLGPDDAPVQIVEFSDFECPYCSRVGPSMKQIKAQYGDKVQIVFRDFPLSFHKQAQVAAEAAQCANAQGKFWEYHDVLFANQKSLTPDALKGYAAQLELDTDQFGSCLDSGTFSAVVAADMQEGQRYGVTGTPAFFVNGRFLNGAQPFEAFKAIIDEELQMKGAL